MSPRVRLTKWGKDHLPTKDGRGTLCGKRIDGDGLPPRGRGLCVQCKKKLLAPTKEAHAHRVRIFGEAGARMLEAQGKLTPEMFGEEGQDGSRADPGGHAGGDPGLPGSQVPAQDPVQEEAEEEDEGGAG